MIKRITLGSLTVLILFGPIVLKASCPAFDTYSFTGTVQSSTEVNPSRRFPFHNWKVFGNSKYRGVILDLDIADFRISYRIEQGSYTEPPPPRLLKAFYQQKGEMKPFRKGESISGLLSQECCETRAPSARAADLSTLGAVPAMIVAVG
jgi:hypothetical protein